MADQSANQEPEIASAGATHSTDAEPRMRSAKPLKVAKALPSAPVPVAKSTSPAAGASELKRPLSIDGGLARPIPLSEAKAAGLLKPVASVSEAAFPEAMVSDRHAAPGEGEESEAHDLGRWKWAASSWGISLIVHLVILLVLGLIVGGTAIVRPEILMSFATPDPLVQPEIDDVRIETPVVVPTEVKVEDRPIPTVTDTLNVKSALVDHLDPGAPPAATSTVSISELASSSGPLDPLGTVPGLEGRVGRRGKGSGNGTGNASSGSGSHLGGRAERRASLSKSGPSQSDPVVDQGLNWLARHQLADGGWAFEHRVGDCRAQCPNPGDLLNARVAATGFALLPFLGAGHSHLEGPYRRTVAGGLRYIMANQGPRGGMVEKGGQMYGHGIATLALCEAFGVADQKAAAQEAEGGGEPDYNGKKADGTELTPEEKKALERQKKFDKAIRVDPKALRDAARRAAGVIITAQHPEGGWRYYPGEAGDMSVVGWQIMALASAQQAGFGFNRATRDRAFNFLRLCGGDLQGDQHYGGVPTRFSYLPAVHEKGAPKVTQATTAIGLLSMIYLGVHPQHPGMEVAVQRLLQQGPNAGDMYYTYYANQVMYQHGGAPWDQWKQRMDQLLLQSQAKGGHMDGSWFLGGDHGSQKGGRVYCTVMALLCLEENYRHMRLFQHALGNQQGQQIPDPKNAAGAQPGAAAAQPGAAAAQPGAAANGQPAVKEHVPQQGGFGGENMPGVEPGGIVGPGEGLDGENAADPEAGKGAPAEPKAKKKPSVPVGEDGFPLE